jgi:DNA helicase-2/ATP-dependent DNA helicase PcrA
VKNRLCYWRLITNSGDDASLRRVINWPARGIGKSSIEALSDHAFRSETSLFDALAKADLVAPRSAAGAAELRAAIGSLARELDALASPSPEEIAHWGSRSLLRLKIKEAISEDEEDPIVAARKTENVEELVHALAQTLKLEAAESAGLSGRQILQEFLSRMVLEASEQEESDKDKEKKEDANQVTLLTLHGAKGLEYPVVFLVGMEEGFLPHKRALEGAEDLSEERRLAYVGITRARDHLILTRAKGRIRYGKRVPRLRSRFLEEIPSDLLIVADHSFPDETSSKEAHQAHEDRVSAHLASIRAMLAGKAQGKPLV